MGCRTMHSSRLGARRIPPAEPVVAAKKPRNIRFPEDDLITSYYLKHPEVRAGDVLCRFAKLGGRRLGGVSP